MLIAIRTLAQAIEFTRIFGNRRSEWREKLAAATNGIIPPGVSEVSNMGVANDGASQGRLRKFLDLIGEVLGEKRRRASFAIYAMGLLGDGERKSMESIAAKACGSVENVDSFHQRLGHFISDSNWSDRAVRCASAAYAIDAMTKEEAIQAWIIDDTGFCPTTITSPRRSRCYQRVSPESHPELIS